MLGGSTTDTFAAPVDMGQSEFAAYARRMIALITRLRALGAETEFDLPKIAVIGNQSAGKSSLVEAISGITVPRAPGRACTRCPMECRLKNSDQPWQCQILLRREVDENGERVHHEDAIEKRFGPVLRDKAELEEMIRRAQLAILNPGVGQEFFEVFDTSSLARGEKPDISPKQLQFSSNVVCLDLQGPDLPDLSFIDLPGIISTVEEDEDERNIEAVRDMVQDHIQGNALILLTVNMRDDMSNQGAARLARLADEAGDRTIGVLTKADLIQDGEQDVWLAILNGSSHSLRHGYFITKHPSPTELKSNISHSAARELEAKFFQMTRPWNQEQGLQGRMGTPNLTKELSNLLGALINQSLPDLRLAARESLDAVREQLEALPPPMSDNPAHELLCMVTTFASEAKSLIQGAESYERLLQKCRPAYEAFKRHILGTAPQFEPFESSAAVEVEDSRDRAKNHSRSMYLDDVRRHIESSLTRELPFNVPFSAKSSLIKRIFESWGDLCTTCFMAVYDATEYELYGVAEQIFGNFQATPLLEQVRAVIDEQLESAKSKTTERIQWILEMEYPPFTKNDEDFSSYRTEYIAQYKGARQRVPTAHNPHILREALDSLAQLGYPATQDTLKRLFGPDGCEDELIVMAETSAYFRVCYKRIIDDIPRVIDHGFLRTIERELQSSLTAALSLGTNQAHERASIYLAEDKQVTATRLQLTQKKDRLEKVREELSQFQVPSGISSAFSPSSFRRRPKSTRKTQPKSSANASVPDSLATVPHGHSPRSSVRSVSPSAGPPAPEMWSDVEEVAEESAVDATPSLRASASGLTPSSLTAARPQPALPVVWGAPRVYAQY